MHRFTFASSWEPRDLRCPGPRATAVPQNAMTAQDARLEAARELFDIAPLQPNIGAEISGVDLTRPLDPAVRDGLRAALLAYRVIFFRDQDMTHAEHIAF